jgi:hypothetical protein
MSSSSNSSSSDSSYSSSSNSSSSNSSSSSSELYHDEIAPRYIIRDDATTDNIVRNDESTNKIIIAPLLYEPTIGAVNFSQDNYSALNFGNIVHSQKYYQGIRSSNKATAKDDCYSGFATQLFNSSTGAMRTMLNQEYSTGQYQYKMNATRLVYDLQSIMSPYRGETIHELVSNVSVTVNTMPYQGDLNPEIRVAYYLTDVFPTKYDYADLDDLATLPYFSRDVDKIDFKSTIDNIDTTFRRYLSIYMYWEDYDVLLPENNSIEYYDYTISGYLGMRWL